jgi:tungstate transport system substrate-binding protein
MVALSDGGKQLFNPYGVIVVNKAKHPKVKAKVGEAFARWLVSPEAQTLIGEFGRKEYGQPLFFPDAPERVHD